MSYTYPDPSPATFRLGDESLKAIDALPADAGSVNGTAIDLGPITGTSARSEACEALLSAPKLTNTQLPNGTTVSYAIQAAAAANFASPTSLGSAVIVQTGNTGAAATSYRFKLPSDCPRYLRAVATSADDGNTSVGNCAAAEMTLELLF